MACKEKKTTQPPSSLITSPPGEGAPSLRCDSYGGQARAPIRSEVIAVQDLSQERCQALAEQFEIRHVYGERLCVSVEQALTVQRILDAIAESSRSGRQVVL